MSPHTILMRLLVGLTLIMAAAACSDHVVPTGIDPEGETADAPLSPSQAMGGNSVYSDRAHSFPEEGFDFLSSTEDLQAGLFRVRAKTEDLPEVTRDDFIVAPDEGGTMTVRRVLESTMDGDELVMDTGPAYWHEIIRGGTYALTMPLDGQGDARFVGAGPQSVAYSLSADGIDLPPLEATFKDTDVCRWIHEVLALIPGSTQRTVCGQEVELEVAYGASLAVSGTLDSLRILEGNVRVSGELDLSVTVDAGGIRGGSAPVFAPCNRGSYLGCLATPTGAALIDFLRRYAPTIPDASLPAIRVCVPGTPVRIRRGYWSGWTWNPPVWETCRITSSGVLPTIILPSMQAATNELRPHVVGDMTIRVVGDGAVTLELPIPYLAAKAAYGVTNDFKAKAEIGIFVLIKTTLKNGGGTVRLVFDDTGRLTQTWTDEAGWEQDFEIVDKSNHAELLELTNPDSVVVRVGVPVKVNAELCIALWACGETEEEGGDPDNEFELTVLGADLFGGDGFNLGAKAGIGVSQFQEVIYTREQIDPDDAEVDNIHLSVEGAYDAFGQAGIHIPLTGWILPNIPREIEGEWECCRVSVADYWGQGALEVTTTTTGVDLDPNGYKVLVERADTLPVVMDVGTQRVGSGWPARTFEENIGLDGTADFGEVAGFVPCIAVYSDALLGNPVWGLSVAAARSNGIGIPTFGATSACRWVIARYRVTLSDVAANCVVTDGAVRDSVWLQQSRFNPTVRDNVKQLHFDVACGVAGAQGDLDVVLDPAGRAPDAPPSVLLNSQPAGVFESDTVHLSGLAPGTYQVELRGLRSLCATAPESVSVVGGLVTSVQPLVVCAAYEAGPGTVTYTASMTGEGPDANGYRLARNGQSAAYLPPDGAGEVTGLAAMEPNVFMVTDIAGNCQAQGLNPRLVTLDASRTAVSVPFPVTCSAAEPDTLVGTLDASGWPVTTVTLRATDGATLVVNGPMMGELARLTGSPVRVWGQSSATGINVHGYDLRSQLGDDRWLGIILDRSDGTWLFGDEAIRLVNPPAGLVGEAGNLVWVMGREVQGGVQPTLYGVIRGG